MEDQFTQEGDHHHLVVGVDYGTTYSGVGFALSSEDAEYHAVQIVEEWPSTRGYKTADKVPSQIAYEVLDPSTGISNRAWGYQIEPHVARCSWMKLHLDNHAIASQYEDPELRKEIENAVASFPEGKTVQDITSDYLKELYAQIMDKLNLMFGKELVAMTKVKFWFTMPAIWSDEAQTRTREAAMTAKFGTRPGDEICMIKEPESAALATLKRGVIDWKDSVRPGEGVLVVDCGGGTVDLTTYTVTQFEHQLVLREACGGIGAKCGATCIERNLFKLMHRYFGEAFNSIAEEKACPGSKFMEDFEYNKWIFGQEAVKLKPMNLFMNGVEKSERYRQKRGKVILKDCDMEEIFDPVISVILRLIRQQINAAGSVKICHLVLVGGFGDSPYLQKELRAECNRHSIKLKAPGNSWNAIAKGAVLRGLGQAFVNTRFCCYHYGVQISKPYEESVDVPKDQIHQDPFSGEFFVSGFMEWHIKKSLEFFTIRRADEREFTTTIYYSYLDEALEKYSNGGIQSMGKCLSVDLIRVDKTKFETLKIGKVKLMKIIFEIEVVLGPRRGILLFKVKIGGRVEAEAEIEFSKD